MPEIRNKFKKSILAELIYVHYENTRYLLPPIRHGCNVFVQNQANILKED
jgi:hypothetical protein